MKYLKQNDSKLLKDIQDVGCFFRCCGLIAEIKTGKVLTADELNNTWKWAKDTRRIDTDNNLRDAASVATRFLRILGDQTGHIIEIGLFKDGLTTFYPSIEKYNPELCKIDFLIQKIKQNGPSGTHFRLVDKSGRLIEDPHEPAIKSQGIIYSILFTYQR